MNENTKNLLSTVRKTLFPLGWVFGLLSSAVIVLSIIYYVQTREFVYVIEGMIGAAQLSLSAAFMMIGKAAKKAELSATESVSNGR